MSASAVVQDGSPTVVIVDGNQVAKLQVTNRVNCALCEFYNLPSKGAGLRSNTLLETAITKEDYLISTDPSN